MSLQVFCRGNTTTGLGVTGSKCEGKTTFVEDVVICEGALQNFAKKGFTAPDGKFIKSTKAFGCLGTSIGIFNHGSRNNSESLGFNSAESSAVDAVLAGLHLLQPFHKCHC